MSFGWKGKNSQDICFCISLFLVFFIKSCFVLKQYNYYYLHTLGAALYYYGTISNSRSVANNSIVRSGDVEGFGILLCTSGSRAADVGRWIAPHGQDITHNTTDIFDVIVGGQNNPGNINISLEAGQSLGSSQQGVYTCIIPDEGGVERIFYVGIYPTNFSSKFLAITMYFT